MKKKVLFILTFFIVSYPIFAANNYDEIFKPLKTVQNILSYAGAAILVVSLIAQGIVMFFSDNMPALAKKAISKVAIGGIFIGGATAISGFILPNLNSSVFYLEELKLFSTFVA